MSGNRAGLVAEARRIDHAVYDAVSSSNTPRLDRAFAALTQAADYSRLSIAAAALLALTGGPRGRLAAVYGLGALAVTATVANAIVKPMTHRDRPDRHRPAAEVASSSVPMPKSSSFPSGHSAAAFAFATGVGHVWPLAAVPLSVQATAVAYSRVHAGVHYPSDVLVGALLGVALGLTTNQVLDLFGMASAKRAWIASADSPRSGAGGTAPLLA